MHFAAEDSGDYSFPLDWGKRLNRTDGKQSNRTHENEISTQFIGRGESGA
jgi:hypothetical protein